MAITIVSTQSSFTALKTLRAPPIYPSPPRFLPAYFSSWCCSTLLFSFSSEPHTVDGLEASLRLRSEEENLGVTGREWPQGEGTSVTPLNSHIPTGWMDVLSPGSRSLDSHTGSKTPKPLPSCSVTPDVLYHLTFLNLSLFVYKIGIMKIPTPKDSF